MNPQENSRLDYMATYTAEGNQYVGPTHKDSVGRLMTGRVNDWTSEYLYKKKELKQLIK
jgi:hypothetical protein